MKKSIFYRLFGLGRMPAKMRSALEAEGLRLSDEGLSGVYVTRDLKAPGKRFKYRQEGFLGWLALSEKRLVAYSFGKRQIHIACDDPKLSELQIALHKPEELTLSFASEVFQPGWQGQIELRFKSEQAQAFYEALRELGLKPV